MISKSASRRVRRERIGGTSGFRRRQEAFRLRSRIRAAEKARAKGQLLRTERGQFVPVQKWRTRLTSLMITLGLQQQSQVASA